MKTNKKNYLILSIAAFLALIFGEIVNAAELSDPTYVRCIIDSFQKIDYLMKKFHDILAGPYNNDQRSSKLAELKKEASALKSKYYCNNNFSKNIDDFNNNLDAIIKNPNTYASMAELTGGDRPLRPSELLELQFCMGIYNGPDCNTKGNPSEEDVKKMQEWAVNAIKSIEENMK